MTALMFDSLHLGDYLDNFTPEYILDIHKFSNQTINSIELSHPVLLQYIQRLLIKSKEKSTILLAMTWHLVWSISHLRKHDYFCILYEQINGNCLYRLFDIASRMDTLRAVLDWRKDLTNSQLHFSHVPRVELIASITHRHQI